MQERNHFSNTSCCIAKADYQLSTCPRWWAHFSFHLINHHHMLNSYLPSPLSYLSETFGYYLKFYPGILWAIFSVYWLNKAQTFKVSPNDSLWHFWEGRNERKGMKKRQGCMKEETWLSRAPTEKLKEMKFDIIFSSDDRVLACAFLWEVKIT